MDGWRTMWIVASRDVGLTKSMPDEETSPEQPRQSRAISAATSCAEIGLNSAMKRSMLGDGQ